MEQEAAELGAGDEPRSRSETTKWGRLTKPEFASWLALGKAPATYSQWKAGSSMCPEAGQARPQKPLKQGFSSADITQAGPAESPAPRHQPMCEFGLTVQFEGLFHKDRDGGMLKSHQGSNVQLQPNPGLRGFEEPERQNPSILAPAQLSTYRYDLGPTSVSSSEGWGYSCLPLRMQNPSTKPGTQ